MRQSTIASILMGRNKAWKGEITVGDLNLGDITQESLMKRYYSLVTIAIYLKELWKINLRMGNGDARKKK